MLVKKAEAVEQASAEAQEALKQSRATRRPRSENSKTSRLRGVSPTGGERCEAESPGMISRDLIIRVTSTVLKHPPRGNVPRRPKRTSGQRFTEQGLGWSDTLEEVQVGSADFMSSLHRVPPKARRRTRGFPCAREDRRDERHEVIQTPENVPRLFDLVELKEPRFAHAFYKALRDTLVAQDLAQANRIASGARGWRVVTLVGELVDSSGTMSGGAAKPRGGVDAVPPDLPQKYEQDSEAAALKLTEAMEELRAAESGARGCGEAGANLGRRASQNARFLTAQNELKRLQSPSGTIEEAIKALEKKILDIGGSQLLAQRAKVDGLKLHIDIASEGITRAEVAMTKAEKDLAKHEGSIARNQQSLEGVEIELEKLSRCRSQEPETKTRRENGAGGYKFGGTGTE
ncbi:hypothetical protein EDB85DRAFT_1897263 [Lactarius pseudohatsudake]|nr:hypothetical protein EDB85DRAFT_1897263 [Lactarius pseudohatsudake]